MKPSGSPNSITCNSKAEYQMIATGASSNYDYNNVVITVKVTAIYNTFSGFEKTENVEVIKELTITCDIGGSGTGQVVIFEGREQTYQIEKILLMFLGKLFLSVEPLLVLDKMKQGGITPPCFLCFQKSNVLVCCGAADVANPCQFGHIQAPVL